MQGGQNLREKTYKIKASLVSRRPFIYMPFLLVEKRIYTAMYECINGLGESWRNQPGWTSIVSAASSLSV